MAPKFFKRRKLFYGFFSLGLSNFINFNSFLKLFFCEDYFFKFIFFPDLLNQLLFIFSEKQHIPSAIPPIPASIKLRIFSNFVLIHDQYF
ncbi:MAG: hypothetical protein CM15mP13_2430 [Pseudomonadota bacterium]|nr:MAG: hypothetical protein CM15mP13_2430 [Pseudomonadota bacterium]